MWIYVQVSMYLWYICTCGFSMSGVHCVCISVHVCMCVGIGTWVFVYICVCLGVCLSVHWFVYKYIFFLCMDFSKHMLCCVYTTNACICIHL